MAAAKTRDAGGIAAAHANEEAAVQAEPVLVLTHGDLDGMVSAILLLQRLPATTPIKITNGDNLAGELEKLCKNDAAPTTLYLADLPLVVARGATRTRAAIAMIAQRGHGLHIYDHHAGWASPDGNAIQHLCRTFIVDSEKSTAAAVIWAHFLDREAKSRRWLRLIAKREYAADTQIRRDFGALAALQQPQHWRHQDDVLHKLVDAESPRELVDELARWYYGVHRPREREIASRATTLATAHGRRIAWIDLRSETGRLMVVRDAIEQHQAEMVVTITAKGVIVNGPAIDRGPDMTPLHGEHLMGGMEFTVVGHRSPVRISPTGGVVDDRFVAVARDFILARLGGDWESAPLPPAKVCGVTRASPSLMPCLR